MKKKPMCFFTIAYGEEYLKNYVPLMRNSIKKFHPDIPHIIIDKEKAEPVLKADPQNKNRMYALFGEPLSKEYELVMGIDSDCIVTGDLSHIINDKSYDVGCVLNNNQVDPKLTVWDVHPSVYVNCGFMAIRGERPWKWWNRLNHAKWLTNYQFVEQDMLNIMVHYGDLNVKVFDLSNKWHGLIHYGQWDKFVMKDEKLIMPKTDGVCGDDKEIKIIHWAGGPGRKKLNYNIYFNKEVCKYLDYLTDAKEPVG